MASGETPKRIAHPVLPPRVVSAIVRLFFACCPSTVPWLVVAILVWKPINRVIFSWFSAHIEEKIAEIIPPFADLDSAASIPVEVSCSRIAASAPHSDPCLVLSGVGFLVFAHEATTALVLASREIRNEGCAFISAFADANKSSLFASPRPL